MGWEHEPETVWRAQELYCVDCLSFDKVADITGIAASTLKRWADKYGWREKREEIAKAEADIRANKVLARSKTIEALLNNPRADMAFAVSALETLTLKEAEAARAGYNTQQDEVLPSFSINTPEDAVDALKKSVEQKLAMLLSRPEQVDLRSFQEVKSCLALAEELKTVYAKDGQMKSDGLSAETIDTIKRKILGIRK